MTTQKPHFYVRTGLRTDDFYTQALLHTDNFPHSTLLHADRNLISCERVRGTRGTTCKSQFYFSFGRSKLHFVRKGCAGRLANRFFTLVFGDRTSFRAKGLRGTACKSQFYFSFWRSNLISRERVARDKTWRLAILPEFLAIEPHFVRKGCAGPLANRNFTSVFGDRTSFRAKGLRGTAWNRNFTSVFGDRISFRAKGFAGQEGRLGNRNFTSVFGESNLISCERVAQGDLQIAILLQFLAIELHFVRKGCVSCRLVGTAPAPAFKREIEKKERARGQEGKRARGQEEQDVSMRGCEDEKMCRCEGEKMWRWEDVRMRRCEDEQRRRSEDEKMWRCEDVKMRGCEDVKMWGCADEKMWGWEYEDERMWGCEDVKMRRCEDVRMWGWEDVRMRRCEEEKMFYRPPLLEEPCTQTLSGKKVIQFHLHLIKIKTD